MLRKQLASITLMAAGTAKPGENDPPVVMKQPIPTPLLCMNACTLILACVLLGQRCTTTSQTNDQLVQNPQPLTLSASISSAPTAYQLVWSVDYQRGASGITRDPHHEIFDFGDAWQSPWAVDWYSGLNGDGPHTVSGILYIFGAVLARCPAVAGSHFVVLNTTRSVPFGFHRSYYHPHISLERLQ